MTRPASARLVDHVLADGRRTWCVTAALLLAVYAVTAHYGGAVTDGLAASWPGWSLAHRGTLFLDGLPVPRSFAVAPVENGHLVALRMPGVVLVSVPLDLLLRPFGAGPLVGGALTAALCSALAMATTGALLRRLASPRLAAVACAVLALGTCVWPVASSELWTHGPDLLWSSLLLYAVVRDRPLLGGLAAVPLVWTRPHLAAVVLCVGLGAAVSRRRWWPAAAIGLPPALALAAMWPWNAWYYGRPSLLGDLYGRYAAANLAVGANGSNGADSHHGLVESLLNLAGFVASPGNGVLLYTPVLLPLGIVIVRQRRRAPAWTWWAFAGGLSYLVLQSRANSFSGGGGFYGYRLALEPVLLTAPVAVACLSHERSRVLRAGVVLAAAGSVAIAAFGALLADYWFGTAGGTDWTLWYPWRVLSAAGVHAVPALVVVAAVVLAGAELARRTWASGGPYRPAEPSALRASGSSTPQSMSRSVSRLGEAS